MIEFEDLKIAPDAYHEYSATLKDNSTAIVIDNGSYKCRVGWSTDEAPLLNFRNLIAKTRKDRKKETTEVINLPAYQIGNDISNIEAVRQQLKTQFERNVVTNFESQEQIFDYVFEHLGFKSDNDEIPHPFLITEAIGNPEYCRQQMTELLFERYNIAGLAYGIDSLFSLGHNSKTHSLSNALILSFGYHTTHVIPVLNGELQIGCVRRLNIGGYHIITYLYRLMQMKYPVHSNAITISRIENLMQKHCSISVDYLGDLKNWASVEYYDAHVKKIQLSFTPPTPTVTFTPEQKIERRKELARRLTEANARRLKERQETDKKHLELLYKLRRYYDSGKKETFEHALKANNIENLTELNKLITDLENRLESPKPKDKTNSDKTSSMTQKEKSFKPPDSVALNDWLNEIRDKRQTILKKRESQKLRRQDMVKRHTAAAQERMRIISQLARNEKADDFGRDDKDWDIYKVISRDDSESDTENEQLLEYENILRFYDQKFEEPLWQSSLSSEHYQLHFGVEATRAPELLFQPSMIGNSEAGLAELINFVLKLFPSQDQQKLVSNVFITGGCSSFPGLKERLFKELLEMRPFQSKFNITEAENKELDAWLGARDFSKTSDFANALISRKDYDEIGSQYFKPHRFSNKDS